jgi:hypothetical protein
LFEFGLGNVLISRQLSSGDVAFVIFLVDVQCLGVKKVHADIVPRAIYENRIYDKLVAHEGVVNIEPAAARKLVEGAVAYAESLGLPPYHEYRVGRLIFSDISVESCTREFTYGRNGKPYFFAGPYDDAARCRDIMQTLERVCGPGGYHYTIPVSPEEIDHDSVEPSEE